jgi:hypothetical protein
MNVTERKILTQELIDKLQAVHESIVEVGNVAEKIATDNPVLATLVMLALVESQEPLAILHGSAKRALTDAATEPNPATAGSYTVN